MKFEFVDYWDRFYILPTFVVVVDPMFVGYKYLSISWLKRSLEISWGHIEKGNGKRNRNLRKNT
jgi:hypothetical protein